MDAKKQQGVTASNEEFTRYERVTKQQRYLLAEQEGCEEFDEDYQIQTCDIGAFLHGDESDRNAFAEILGKSLEDIGFAILTGHGIAPALYKEVARGTRKLFLEHSLEEKMHFRARRQGSVNQGYFPLRETSDIHPDLVEGWVFCRRAFDIPGASEHRAGLTLDEFWPDPELEPLMRRLVQANERLIHPVMQSLLMHLECDPHLYDAKLTKTNIGLRLNYYPPLSMEDVSSGAGRLLGHEDVGMFVFLPAPEIAGLQVLNRRNMKWVRLDAPRGSIILNTGDYVQRISNDVFPSTTHRVSRTRDPKLDGRERLSFPMNVYVWENEMLEVLPGLKNPRYSPIRALEFHTQSTAKFYGDDYAVTR